MFLLSLAWTVKQLGIKCVYVVFEETRPYQNPTNLYEIKWHMENVLDMSSPPRWDYLLSVNAKAKDGGRATLSVEMSLKHSLNHL